MSLKTLPIRGPASKVLPRKRSVGERIVATLELAALVRTIARVFGRRKRRRIPSRRGLLALAGGGLLAAIAGVLLAKRKSGAEQQSPPSYTPPEPPAKADDAPKTDDGPKTEASDDPVPAAVAAAQKLDDAEAGPPNEGGPGHHPTEEDAS